MGEATLMAPAAEGGYGEEEWVEPERAENGLLRVVVEEGVGWVPPTPKEAFRAFSRLVVRRLGG